LTAPAALAFQRTLPSLARSEYTVPSSLPRNTRPRSISGEDSARLGSLRDHRVRPERVDTATTRPALVPRERLSSTA
jgi:hypothetical protein